MKNLPKLILICWLLAQSASIQAQYIPKEERNKTPKKDSITQENHTKVEPLPSNQKNRNERPSGISNDSFRDRLIFGGSTWFQFGTLTRIDLFPTVGYKLTDKFIAGIGVNYQFLKGNYIVNTPQGRFSVSVSESYYGGRIFGQHFIIPPVFAWAELETTNGNFYDLEVRNFRRQWITSPLVGLGYQQSTGGKLGTGFYMMILYNLTYRETLSQYASPWLTRVGFAF